ncbi:MAG: molecular chaperone TorD family protein, partial [Calditerrivibrio sp.]|nr:molecular chaperone TorD family protein [Calditerrivibrio sp.]
MIEDFDLENVKSIEETDLKESLSMFSNLCIYLSLIFRYPDSNVYKSLRDYFDEFKFFLLDYELSSPDLPLQEDLEVEYVRLFVANYGGVIAPLYSSVYTSEEKLLLRDSTIKLRDIMHEEGFVLRDDVKDVEDNLYILFEFIGLLLSRALETDFRKI